MILWKLKHIESNDNNHKTDDELDALPFMRKFVHFSEITFTF